MLLYLCFRRKSWGQRNGQITSRLFFLIFLFFYVFHSFLEVNVTGQRTSSLEQLSLKRYSWQLGRMPPLPPLPAIGESLVQTLPQANATLSFQPTLGELSIFPLALTEMSCYRL
jgi:hypothetical protein